MQLSVVVRRAGPGSSQRDGEASCEQAMIMPMRLSRATVCADAGKICKVAALIHMGSAQQSRCQEASRKELLGDKGAMPSEVHSLAIDGFRAQPRGVPPSSSRISCWSTIEYTLALSRVKTVAVLRSRPRRESRISTEGLAASSARMFDSCAIYEYTWWCKNTEQWQDIHCRGCRQVWRTRPALPAPAG